MKKKIAAIVVMAVVFGALLVTCDDLIEDNGTTMPAWTKLADGTYTETATDGYMKDTVTLTLTIAGQKVTAADISFEKVCSYRTPNVQKWIDYIVATNFRDPTFVVTGSTNTGAALKEAGDKIMNGEGN